MIWAWIFIGLTFISKLHGYSNGDFPEACESMRPRHGRGGAESLPETSEPPYMVSYQLSSNVGDPITVSLESKNGFTFRGFMLEARNLSLNGDGPPLGKFIMLDSDQSILLKCGNSQDSAVGNAHNLAKRLVKVNWTADGEEQGIVFRATFLESYSKYWERVNVTVLRPSSTPEPQTTTATATTAAATTAAAATTQIHTTKDIITTVQSNTIPATHNTTNKTVIILLICVASPLAEMSMKFRIAGSSLSVLFSLATLILSLIYNSRDVIIGLVSVVLAISSMEWILAVLPLGPSHELNELVDCALWVCFVFHQVLINVFLYVGISSLFEEWGQTTRVFWLLIVHTSLTVVWNMVLCAKKKTLLQKKRVSVIGKTKYNQHHKGNKEHLSPKGVIVVLCSVTLVVLSTSLSVLIFVDYF